MTTIRTPSRRWRWIVALVAVIDEELELVDVEFPVGVEATAREARAAAFILSVRPRTAAGVR